MQEMSPHADRTEPGRTPADPPPLPPRRADAATARRPVVLGIVAGGCLLAALSAAIGWLHPEWFGSPTHYTDTDTPEAAYDHIFTVWDQTERAPAEALLRAAIRRWPDNQRLAFFYAACLRSSSGNQHLSPPWFQRTAELGPETPHGRCANMLLRMEVPRTRDKAYEELVALIKEAPDDPLLLWMGACAAEDTGRLVQAEACYARLLERIVRGPANVHSGYANILTKLKRYDEAVAHHRQAVDSLPRGWAYRNLILTLMDADRAEEALLFCPLMIERAPDNSTYWQTWGSCLFQAGRPDEGREKYLRAIELAPEHPNAYHYLAYQLREHGQGEEAIPYFEKAADMGLLISLTELGRTYLWGLGGTEKDPARALPYLREAAGKGEKFAQLNHGTMYRDGLGVEKDLTKAANWYMRAAAQGLMEAQVTLGDAYRKGEGVTQDDAMAFRYYQEAANGGSVRAMSWLGYLYRNGVGTAQDYELARYWFATAAELGSGQTPVNLVHMLIFDRPEQPDTRMEIARWTDFVKERGDAASLNSLAWWLATAWVEELCDGPRAVQLARKACEQEPENAMYLDTLAAAYARDGQFEHAIATQGTAIDLAMKTDHADLVPGFRARLALYMRGKPHVEH